MSGGADEHSGPENERGSLTGFSLRGSLARLRATLANLFITRMSGNARILLENPQSWRMTSIYL